MNIPKNLRYLRQKKGVKPKDIAKATKIDAQTIYQWEHNKLQPNDDQLKKISAYYGIDIIMLKNTDLKETITTVPTGRTIAEKSPTTLSKNIRDLRSGVLKINRKGLAQKLGVSEDDIAHWEHGEKEPDIPTLNQLAELFGTTTEALRQKAPIQRTHLKSVKKPERTLQKSEKPLWEEVPKTTEAVSPPPNETETKLARILSFASTLHDLDNTDLEKLESYVNFLRFEKAKNSQK